MPFVIPQRVGHVFTSLCVAVFSILLTSCSNDINEEKADVIRPVRTTVIVSAPREIRRVYPAVVLPAQQAELSFRVSGRLIELPIRAAMEVSEGDMIAQLDKRDFASTVAQLDSQLEQAKSQLEGMTSGARTEDLKSLRAKVRAAEAQMSVQRKQVDRISSLVERGTIARVDLEQERAKLIAEEANLNTARQELTKAEVGARSEEVDAQEAVIRGLETQVAKARDDLSDATLRAPFDGVIASRSVENFSNVQANSVIAVLQKLKTIDLRFDVPGPDVTKFARRKNSVIKARLDSTPDSAYEAQLVEFATQADAATQTFRGRASMEYPEDITVLPGMTGSVLITAALDEQQTLSVPASALAAEPDGSAYVWVVTQPGNTVSKRIVTTKNLAGSNVEIVDGVAEGDVVVTAGVSYLRENMIVRPIVTTE
ncbi:MAG: efflux RND transporter periplasmic adaptor subunit [Candidatus Thiodiazotropha sp.]|nr:efflux RND transporter periplasmic adaptor subunit [Candidatus Thiodiazotropha sp.]MCM8883053.1 efflux RND transporter periplasmic adaptor subunit [Candidatus Thiodiazotropha sp.]MCM8918853.1 efflux RND transporter periplasmic adaptor subunit [Candidatus Thiodiazotropha sp.]